MKINKEIRRTSREMLQASFTDGQLDRGKIGATIQSLIARKRRRTIAILQNYKRLLRLEIEKRTAKIESAIPLDEQQAAAVTARLKQKYGDDLTTQFEVNSELIGGMRVRVGSDVWDGTVRNRLQRLEQQL
jgi:F-type H+-transporting ATPase subunit delta